MPKHVFFVIRVFPYPYTPVFSLYEDTGKRESEKNHIVANFT